MMTNVSPSRNQMEQKAVVRFLTLKAFNPGPIRSQLESVCHTAALALSPRYKCYARFRDGRTEPEDDPKSGSPGKNDLADPVSPMLEKRPFPSSMVLARHFRVANAPCRRIVHDDLGLKKFYVPWVPHTLDSISKHNCVTLSRERLQLLC
jgi:hypothetical protein